MMHTLLALLAAPTFAWLGPAFPKCTVPLRTSCLRACDLDQPLEAADSAGLYESLQARRTALSSRRESFQREAKLIKALAETWPASERAVPQLWEHWYSEEGDAARRALQEAAEIPDDPVDAGEATELLDLMAEYPDWAEPPNRLATLRFMQGRFEDSVQLCLVVLRLKPWHFGALSGIVMCYAKLGNMDEAQRWANEAMPQPGSQRESWVERQIATIDEKLAEIDAM